MGKYLEGNLGRDETVIYEAKMSWFPVVVRFVLLTPLLFICFTVMYGGLTYDIYLSFLFCGCIIFCFLLPAIIDVLCTELGITNKKILGKTGLIRTYVMDSPLNKINNVFVSNGLFGKIFNYGNVIVTTAAQSYKYRFVSDPNFFRAAVMNQIDKFDEEKIKKQAEEIAAATRARYG